MIPKQWGLPRSNTTDRGGHGRNCLRFVGNTQNTDLAPALPANVGAYAPDDAANNSQWQKQVIATVPAFPKLNALVPWKAAVCRGLVAAACLHGNREIFWFSEATRKTYDQLGDPRV